MKLSPNRTHRRAFLRKSALMAAAAGAFPSIIPSSALGADGLPAASEWINVACIGVGPQGTGVMRGFLAQKNARVTVVCDVKQDQREQAAAIVNAHYQSAGCKVYSDFRKVLERRDIDACLIATPDHWHVPIAIASVRAGKDVYLEKPIGCSVAEGQALRKAVLETGRVFQFGTQQRSDRNFRLACELARSGALGKLKTVYVWAPGSAPGGSTKITAPPATLDYDFWLGPAPMKPYAENRCDADGATKTWWFDSDYAVGFIAGWGIHPMDIAIWGAGDLMKGKVELEGAGNYPTQSACNTATTWDVKMTFASGLRVIFAGSPNGANASKPTGEIWPYVDELRARCGTIATHGTLFEGSDGWALVSRGSLVTSPPELAQISREKLGVRLKESGDHVRDFLNSVVRRARPISSIEDAVWGDTMCNIADIAARLRRRIEFDFATERFTTDAEANARLQLRAMRSPWKLT